MTAEAVTVRRRRGYAVASCTCGWVGPGNPTRTVEGVRLAERDAEQHRRAHAEHRGFFDYVRGWVAC